MANNADGERKQRGRPRGPGAGPSGSVQSLDRALEVMRVVADGDGMSLSQVAEAAALAPSTAHRIITTLERNDYVRQDLETGNWTVGVGAFTVGQAFIRIRRIESLSRASMRSLMETTGETVNLGMLEGTEVVYLAQVECNDAIRAFFRPGRRVPAHASGIGKMLLAEADPRRIRALFEPGALRSFTERTITDRRALTAELRLIGERGWSLDNEEHTPGMRCVAAPIFDERGEAIAAISISGPSARLTTDVIERNADRTIAAAHEITRLVGGTTSRQFEG